MVKNCGLRTLATARVLVFNTIPTENYVAADGVIGKPNFNERDYDNADAIWPYSVK